SVAGIVAGRVKEKYNRPTIVLTRGKEGIKGSARSIEGYHIFNELNKVSHLLERFGGHPMAAGLSLKDANLEQLREMLNRNSRLTEDDLTPKIYIEMPMDPGSFDWNLLSEIEKLEPFGKGNPKPLFGFKGLKIHKAAILGKNSNVLKLIIGKDYTEKLEGMVFSDPEMWVSGARDSFGQQEVENALAGQRNSICMDIVYYPSVNDYMGRKSIQFIIDSYRFKE
ncbi:MAG TPA: DHHA1 domain-containing protein, partial [Gudongella oleilytica]|nr:DHHA1 domain-containing protein [Gudongella oleilytica]